MKCVFNKDGEETVFEFAYENSFICDYYSFITGSPSTKDIICLEDTLLYVITRNTLEKLANDYAFVARMNSAMNEQLFKKMHQRLKSVLLDDASERYEKLLEERMDLVTRIPQYLIASYLNIKPETLSRLRRKNLA